MKNILVEASRAVTQSLYLSLAILSSDLTAVPMGKNKALSTNVCLWVRIGIWSLDDHKGPLCNVSYLKVLRFTYLRIILFFFNLNLGGGWLNLLPVGFPLITQKR